MEILKDFKEGLTLKSILKQYKLRFNEDLQWGYMYITRLVNAGLIMGEKSDRTKGKELLYKLIENPTPKTEDNKLLEKLYDFMGEYMEFKKDKKNEAIKHKDILIKVKELIQ